MATKKKIQNNTTKVKKTNRSQDASLDYYMQFDFRERPVSQTFYDRLAVEFMQEALENPKALTPESFYIKKRIPQRTWYDWLEKSPRLKEAHQFALMVFGEKREMGMLIGDENGQKLSERAIMFTMPQYKKSWKDLHEWYEKIKEEKPSQGTTIKVVMPEIPKIEEKQ